MWGGGGGLGVLGVGGPERSGPSSAPSVLGFRLTGPPGPRTLKPKTPLNPQPKIPKRP